MLAIFKINVPVTTLFCGRNEWQNKKKKIWSYGEDHGSIDQNGWNCQSYAAVNCWEKYTEKSSWTKNLVRRNIK